MRTRPSAALVLLLAAACLVLAGCQGTLVDYLVNFWSLSCCGTLIAVLDVIALVELAGSTRSTRSKVLWGLFIVFFPVLGLLVYYFVGR